MQNETIRAEDTSAHPYTGLRDALSVGWTEFPFNHWNVLSQFLVCKILGILDYWTIFFRVILISKGSSSCALSLLSHEAKRGN